MMFFVWDTLLVSAEVAFFNGVVLRPQAGTACGQTESDLEQALCGTVACR